MIQTAIIINTEQHLSKISVSWTGLAIRRYAGIYINRWPGFDSCFTSPFSSTVLVYGHALRSWSPWYNRTGGTGRKTPTYLLTFSCLVTLSLTVNETLSWLSTLPVFMQKSFWWSQCSIRYSPPPPLPPPPFQWDQPPPPPPPPPPSASSDTTRP